MTVDNRFIIRKLQGLKEASVLGSLVTKHPFVVCDPESFDDQITIYAEPAKLEEEAKAYLAQGYQLQGLKVEGSQLPKFLIDCYFLGINQIVYRENDMKMSLPLEQLVVKPDFTKLPEAQRPLFNPELQLSTLYFLQEMTRKIPNEQKDQEHLKELEEEMAANIAKSRFLVPIKSDKKLKPGEKLEPGKFHLALLNTKDKKQFIPIFSDVNEFTRFNRKGEFQGILMTIDKLMGAMKDPCEGLIENPGSFGLKLTRQMVNGILERFFEFE